MPATPPIIFAPCCAALFFAAPFAARPPPSLLLIFFSFHSDTPRGHDYFRHYFIFATALPPYLIARLPILIARPPRHAAFTPRWRFLQSSAEFSSTFSILMLAAMIFSSWRGFRHCAGLRRFRA
jgi:hypothetical protein